MMEYVEFHLHGKPKLIDPYKIMCFEDDYPCTCCVTFFNRRNNEVSLIVDESYEEVQEKLKDFEWIEDLG